MVYLVIHLVWKKHPGVITYIGLWGQWMVTLVGQGLERWKDWGQSEEEARGWALGNGYNVTVWVSSR